MSENYLLRKQDVRKFCSEFYEWLNKPSISPLMLLILVGTIISTVLVNSVLFTQIALIGMIITIITYIPIALVKAKLKSGLLTLVGKILDILIDDNKSDEQKIAEEENTVMLLMQDINKYYEKKLQQFTNHLRTKKEVIK